MGTEGHARTDSYLLIDSYLHIKKVARVECIDRLFARLVKINGSDEAENRIKEGKKTLRWDKTSCHRFAAK
jgi:hypothetical protein